MYQLTNVSKLYAKGGRTVPAVRELTLAIADGVAFHLPPGRFQVLGFDREL